MLLSLNCERTFLESLYPESLISRRYESLIAAAQCYESHSDLGRGKVKQELSTWQPTDANFIQLGTKKPDFRNQGKSPSKPNSAGNFRNKTKSGQLHNISSHTYPSLGQGSGNKSKSQGGGDPAIRFAFILIVMSPQPASCPTIYVEIVASISV